MNEKIIKLYEAAINERDPDKRFGIVWEISVLIDKQAGERFDLDKDSEQ